MEVIVEQNLEGFLEGQVIDCQDGGFFVGRDFGGACA